MKDIIELYKEYGSTNRLADREFLRRLTDFVIAEEDTQEFLENGITTDEKQPMLFAQAAYEKDKKQIHYYYEDMIVWNKYEAHVYYPGKNNLTPEQEKLLINLLMGHTALHELEHVAQEKKRIQDNGIEGDLLRFCDGKKETISTYEILPSERMAEIVAWEKIIKIANALENVSPEMMMYFEKQFKDSMLRGYEKSDGTLTSPTNEYFCAHGESKNIMSLEVAQQQYPDLKERLIYGFPITQEEYEEYRNGEMNVTKSDIARADVEAKFSVKELGKRIIDKLFGKNLER